MKDATFVTLYKQKGDKGDCNNYRGISLMSVSGKTFAKVLLPRLQKIADRIYPESQCGFRSGRSTADSGGHVCCTAKARLPSNVAQVNKIFTRQHASNNLLRGSYIGAFWCAAAVKQGCVLAPTLFGIFFSTLLHHAFGNYNNNDDIYLHTRSDNRLFNLSRLSAKDKVRRVLVRELLFADDAAFVSHNPEGLQSLMDRFSAACPDFSLIISTKKTVVMNCSATNSPAIPIFVEDQELNVVDKFCTLGSTISTDLTLDNEMKVRIGKASTAFSWLRTRAWNNRLLTERTKTRIYETCELSILLYGYETWTTYTRHEKKLNAFHMRHLRRIIGLSWEDHVTNEEVLTRTGSHSMFYILKARRTRWLGHLRRKDDGRLPKDILYGELSSGSRQRGRPVLRFKDWAKRDLANMGIPLENWEVTASDCGAWKTAVRAEAFIVNLTNIKLNSNFETVLMYQRAVCVTLKRPGSPMRTEETLYLNIKCTVQEYQHEHEVLNDNFITLTPRASFEHSLAVPITVARELILSPWSNGRQLSFTVSLKSSGHSYYSELREIHTSEYL
ncbi:uncharacterized protein LOC125034034 [Penaeus chinensis]|uniref:uncharacterized protein LOC125034034 n=1 Tax=Penaeus chinensis TaxID=139456 RepID=UPI001FB67F34|nr:uncharacterized protein LOC125034034 [Penaeus chinensis]